MPTANGPTFVFGDIHGHRDRLAYVLREAGLVDVQANWIGERSALWFVGDFFDRGSDGIGVLEMVMRLQEQARRAGGSVSSLLGNHEICILSAYFFGHEPTGWGGNFTDDWLRNGGRTSDLDRLHPNHVEWLLDLPAMALVGDHLLVHADALFYYEYGRTVDEVNAAFRRILHSHDAPAWDTLLGQFGQRGAFVEEENGLFGDSVIYDSPAVARQFLKTYGGKTVVHGHTPIAAYFDLSGAPAEEPYVYNSGLCVNVDGGLYLGGPGFLYRVPPTPGGVR